MIPPKSLSDLREITLEEKHAVNPLLWRIRPSKGNRVVSEGDRAEVVAPLMLAGVVAQGLALRVACVPSRPDERVAVLLTVEWKGKPKPLARIDWRGSRHENRHQSCPPEWRFTDAGTTHFHDPDLHQTFEINELLGGRMDLPVARPIMPAPTTFADLMEISSQLLHISNLTELDEPPWQPNFT